MSPAGVLLVRLVGAHVAADFLFQPDRGVGDRQRNKWRSVWLCLHGIIAGATVYVLSGLWGTVWLPVTIAVTHTIEAVKK